jgi:ankyrin repeat protein
MVQLNDSSKEPSKKEIGKIDHFNQCVSKGDIKSVSELLEKGFDINSVDLRNWPPLFYAIVNNQKEMCDFLISKGANIEFVGGPYFLTTPLIVAAMAGNEDICNLLLSKGSNIESCRDKCCNSTPLSEAAFLGNKNIVELLVRKGADINICMYNQNSVLERAIISPNWDILEMVKFGKIDWGSKNGQEIQEKIKRDKLEILQFLLENGADLTKGEPPLIVAARCNNKEASELLIKYGAQIAIEEECSKELKSANNKDAPIKCGETPLFYADSPDLVKFLISKGANVNLKNKDGWSALHFAARKGNLEKCKILIENKVEIDSLDKYGETALLKAARSGIRDSGDICSLLIENGANVNVTDRDGNTPLLLASAYSAAKRVVEILLLHNADINAKNKNGENALFKVRSAEIAQLLISNGIDVSVIAKDGTTALLKSILNNNDPLAELILKAGADLPDPPLLILNETYKNLPIIIDGRPSYLLKSEYGNKVPIQAGRHKITIKRYKAHPVFIYPSKHSCVGFDSIDFYTSKKTVIKFEINEGGWLKIGYDRKDGTPLIYHYAKEGIKEYRKENK